ncbi:molybdopterin molybdotransferase MoeA [Nocardia cyriacigeorgica]|uniref:Molybdopterin molybdenumtransferase n=1 Tax=Nocardia cyriacigeorgica TaxID=135487 RepID=A0A6P1D7D9_9NOCA|nr:gephyrin-like molybdotransferase Glp [Nocardia cyriacigeorgica]NEW41191.1 molybdopterin molybdotransferase MoeA [Nocardia cyriacigeorgica]NEW46367.1 molybdopterin molybdotransferase MoeA [Nocardia cyriacigeorgica]NEW52094.1 molybdopterin molybdotransferase MoeA [Nocardia cyriacigeorgica]NEW57866.1 molybdopterin molybdotransferase MoeA [Nocardia cyriacigeorgica]
MTIRSATVAVRSVDEYRDSIEALLRPLAARPVETVAVSAALGRQLADTVRAPLDLPVFRNSAMDGYAVRSDDVAVTPVTLPLSGVVAAGDPGLEPLAPGTARKVMTGAPIPPGADCVVPVEDAGGEAGSVTIERGRSRGEYVREPGTDVRAGEELVGAGTTLAARHIAALAAVGLPTVRVFQPVRATVITSGDELVPAGTALRPGQIYNSNGIALAAALTANGVTVTAVEHSGDQPAQFRRTLTAATGSADVVFTTGGVSKGDFEVVKDVLEPMGGHFGSVAVQPGGPQGLTVVDGVPVLSFPGNPVSAMVSFEVFARPILRRLAGLPEIEVFELPLLTAIRSPQGRRQFLRGRLAHTAGGPRAVEVVSGPGSHLVASMAAADVLIDVPAEVGALPVGAPVRVWSL